MPVKPSLLLIAALLLPLQARANPDLVLVVNAKSGVERLSQEEAVNIFMGRYRQLPSGVTAQPIDQPESQPEKALFYRLLVNKDLAEINAYWARLIFSGKTSPPHQSKSTAETLDLLARQRGAIAYIQRNLVDSRFRVVLDLEP